MNLKLHCLAKGQQLTKLRILIMLLVPPCLLTQYKMATTMLTLHVGVYLEAIYIQVTGKLNSLLTVTEWVRDTSCVLLSITVQV